MIESYLALNFQVFTASKYKIEKKNQPVRLIQPSLKVTEVY